MKSFWRDHRGFWSDVALTAVTLTGLAIVARVRPLIFTISQLRFPAMMIGVVGSRAVLENAGVTGYYERLFGKLGRQGGFIWPSARSYDRTFRIVRNKPNLDQQRDGVTTNSFGLIGRECSLHKPPNTRRVALLGSSISMGLGIDPSLNYASLLQDRLNATRPGGTPQQIEILNFSVAGHQLAQLLDVAVEDAPRFEPDVYVLDLNEVEVFRNWDEQLVRVVQLGIDPKYDFLREIIRSAGASRQDDTLTLFGKLAPFRLPVVRESLVEMKANAERHNASFLVVLVPSVEDDDLSRQRLSGIRELLGSLNITFVDLLDTFDNVENLESLRIEPSDVHPNARGHAMIFENLYAKLQAQPDAWGALVGPGSKSTQQAKVSSAGKPR